MLKFLIGGLVVCLFAELADIFQPKSFAGLFGAAPSVALASLGIALWRDGSVFAATEARSMIAGALAFSLYAFLCSWMLMRRAHPAVTIALAMMPAWFGAAFTLYFAGKWLS